MNWGATDDEASGRVVGDELISHAGIVSKEMPTEVKKEIRIEDAQRAWSEGLGPGYRVTALRPFLLALAMLVV